MSNFFHPSTSQVSRKDRKCIYCAEPINKGETYTRQTGVFEGSWQDNQFHPECFDDAFNGGDNEFMPYDNERPKKDPS